MLNEESYGLNFKHCPELPFLKLYSDVFGTTACCPIKNKKTIILKMCSDLDFSFNNQPMYE